MWIICSHKVGHIFWVIWSYLKLQTVTSKNRMNKLEQFKQVIVLMIFRTHKQNFNTELNQFISRFSKTNRIKSLWSHLQIPTDTYRTNHTAHFENKVKLSKGDLKFSVNVKFLFKCSYIKKSVMENLRQEIKEDRILRIIIYIFISNFVLS